MKPLPQEDERYLIAAEGWLGLGDHLSANEELEQIAVEWRAHPQVLIVRLNIYRMAKKWEACLEIANAIIKATPDILYGWIGRSFALHELKCTQEAYDLLLPAKDKFPKEHTVPYNLACYCAQLNRLEEAEKWFKQAMAINERAVQLAAVDDPDLDPLWAGLGGRTWKKA
ncbi:MAG: tetratricopeptide repeat protein [Limisphaerales bacterium]